MSAENFQMSNPNYLMQGGISTVPIPFRDIGNIKRGSGPVKDMCYVLLERDYEISHDDAVPHPTEANPEDYKGWKIIGKGVFKGWKDWNKDDEDEVNFRDKFGINIEHGAYNEQRNIWNPKLIDEKTKKEIEIGKDKVRFVRNYRARFDRWNEMLKYYSSTNNITNNLYWKQCMHDITREQAEEGSAKMNQLEALLNKDNKTNFKKLGAAEQELIGSFRGTKDGGYKRKKKRKRRKSKKRKTRRRKRKTHRRKTRRRKRKKTRKK
jgi:hypothetical protein